jgi:hypothetical protein
MHPPSAPCGPSLQVGLPMLNAPEAYVSPYGVAINKQAAGSELEQRLVYALTGYALGRAASMLPPAPCAGAYS